MVPATLLLIFILLFLNFGRVGETLIVMGSLPFALVGGVLIMYFLGYNWSVATGVGFIALAGVAAETAVIMLLYLNHAWDDRIRAGTDQPGPLHDAVMEGAVLRVRPKVMTVTTIIVGLLPILWGHGTGASVMKRIAAPMVGGMVSATVLTLVVVPVIYFIWQGVAVDRGQDGTSPRESKWADQPLDGPVQFPFPAKRRCDTVMIDGEQSATRKGDIMETKPLGNSDLQITPVGLGAWAMGGDGVFGWGPQDDAESVAAIHRSVERGINWIDTAPIYGMGHSEKVVARALKEMGSGQRPLVFTKCSIVWDDEKNVGHSLKARLHPKGGGGEPSAIGGRRCWTYARSTGPPGPQGHQIRIWRKVGPPWPTWSPRGRSGTSACPTSTPPRWSGPRDRTHHIPPAALLHAHAADRG